MAEVGSVALLAPIPLEHLSDGVEVCTREGKVAFGSQAWEALAKFEDLGGTTRVVYSERYPSKEALDEAAGNGSLEGARAQFEQLDEFVGSMGA